MDAKQHIVGLAGRRSAPVGAAAMPRCVCRTGFTLLELIVVLSILSILSAAVVPVFRGGFSGVRADHAVRDLVATIKHAQERAITDAVEIRLYLDDENSKYHLRYLAGIEDEEKIFKPLPMDYGTENALPEGMEFDRLKAGRDRDLDMRYITFYPNGASDEAAITIRRPKFRSVSIKMDGALGGIEVKDGRRR